jgi:hypothetical protein
MEERQARRHYKSLVDGGGGAVRQKWRRRRGKSLVKGHKMGRASAMVRSLCELEWGKRRKEGMGFDRQGGVRATVPKRKEKRGVRYGDEGKNREPTRVPGSEGVQCDKMRRVRHSAVATRERHTWAPPQMASAGHAVTATRRM